MTQDKANLEAQLQRYTNDWTSLQAGIAERQQEVDRIKRRMSQLRDEIVRNQGALAYVQIRSDELKKQLTELERASGAPPASA